MKFVWPMLIVLSVFVSGVLAEDAAQKVAVEVESFKLTDAKVVALEGASGGKAVEFSGEKSRAVGSVTLSPGTWYAALYMIGGAEDEDAVFLEFGGVKARLYQSEFTIEEAVPSDYDLVEPRAKIEKDGECEVVLSFAEPNVRLDRIVFRKE